MRIWMGLALICLAATPVVAASTPRQDALLDRYFSIWDDNAHVNPETVEKLYARHVAYWGQEMTREGVYRNKLNFIRRWPERHYTVEQGSGTKQCDADENNCLITATLVWTTSGAKGTKSGRSRVSLALAREDGALKIVREGGGTAR